MTTRKYDPSQPSQYDSMINDAAAKAGINAAALRKQLWLESDFKADAQSPTGPKGIAQFTTATAAAYGLSDADRLDPVKAIPAAAAHMAELTKKFGGDELKAALAYNVGEGPKGAPQLAAYDRGDFAGIGVEGLNYMRTMSDSVQSDKLEALRAFGGISRHADAKTLEEITQGVGSEPKVKVGENLPESTSGLNITGKAVDAANKPFMQSEVEAHGDPDDKHWWDTFSGTKDAFSAGAHNSVAGVAYNDLSSDNGLALLQAHFTPTAWNSHQWTPEELDRIRTEVKNPAYIKTVLGGDSETLDDLIKRANSNAEYDAKAAQAGTGAQLIGGITGAAFDPLTYVGGVGAATKAVGIGGKLLKAAKVGSQAAVLNVVSEGLRTEVAGGDAHYKEAALGGLVLGGGMSLAHDAIGALRGTHSVGLDEVSFKEPSEPVSVNPVDSVGNIPANPYRSTTTRLEARSKAQAAAKATGSDDFYDPTKIPLREGEELKTASNGSQYVEAPNFKETGDVRLPSGEILSGSNPLNPHTLDLVEATNAPAKANAGARFMGMTELGLTLLRSESDSVRSVGLNLVRPSTGLKGGMGGKMGATASDISERMRYADHQFFNDVQDLTKKALKDPEFSLKGAGSSDAELQQAMSRRVAEAVEDSTDSKLNNLTSAEKELVELIRDHHQFKAEAMKRPSMFGNVVDDSKAVLDGSHFEGHYYPVSYSASARSAVLSRLGGDVQELKEAIKESMLGSYRSNLNVKARVDEYLKATGETVEDYAEKKAYGIANANGDAAGAYRVSTGLEDVLPDSTKLAQNDYLKARQLFGSDFEVTLRDGGKFSINDLRHFDFEKVLPGYNRRVNGDIAILGGTGKTTKELVEHIDSLTDAQAHEVQALKETVKVLTGRARINPEGVLGTLSRSLSDMAYASKNAFMGVQNYTEIASMITRGSLDSLVHAVPSLGKYVTRRSKLNAKELSEAHAVLFGKELDDSLMPSRADIVERLRMAGTGETLANVVGGVKWATGRMAARLPMSRVMVSTTNHIVKAARIETLSRILKNVHEGKAIEFGKLNKLDRVLRSASISDAQLQGIKDLMLQHTFIDKSGKYAFKDLNEMRLDPRSMDLWRLADHVASETILRPDKVSFQSTKAHGGALGMAMQFKNYVLRSVNGRTLRRFYEATQNGRAMDQALTVSIEAGLAAGFIALRSHVVAAGMQDADAKRYLDKALDPGALAVGAVTRSSTLGAPLGLYGFLATPFGLPGADLVNSYRTTLNPHQPREKDPRAIKGGSVGDDFMSKVIDGTVQQVPGIQWAKDATAAFGNGVGSLSADSSSERMMFNDALYRSLSRVVPNDPVTQWVLKEHFEHNVGIYQDQKRYKH